MNKLVVVGTGGHGKVVADNALKNGYSNIYFVDDKVTGECLGFPIIGRCSDLTTLDDGNTDFVIGIGNNTIRKKIASKYDVNWVTIIHPSAQVAGNVVIGKGSVVMAGAIINVSTAIGKHCIINTSAVIEHDNAIKDFVHISPGAKLGGTVTIGEQTHIGIGATVVNNIDICSNCTIGAGSVVVRNIDGCGTYIGVPARKYK